MKQNLLDLNYDDFQLSNNYLFKAIKNININDSVRFCEENRRALNLLLDLQNRHITTKLLLQACIFREESRGGHFRTDFQEKSANWECHSRQCKNKNIQKRFN